MNKNGLRREVGLIIIHFESVKTFSQISPRRRWVKNPFAGSVPWQRAGLPGDRGYDSGECACVFVGWRYVCVCTYAFLCAPVCMHVCTVHFYLFFLRLGLRTWESLDHAGSQTNTGTPPPTRVMHLTPLSLFSKHPKTDLWSFKGQRQKIHYYMSWGLWNRIDRML